MKTSFVFITAASLLAGASLTAWAGVAPIGEQGGTIALGANGYCTLPGLDNQLQNRRGIGIGQQGYGTTIGEQGASVPPTINTPQFEVNARGGLTPIGEQGGTIALGAKGYCTLPQIDAQLQNRRGIGIGQQGYGTTIGEQGASVPPTINTPQFEVNARGGLTPIGEQGGTIALGAKGYSTLPGLDNRHQSRRGIRHWQARLIGEQGGTIALGASGFSTLPEIDAQLQNRRGIGIGQQGYGTTIGEQGASVPPTINTTQFQVNAREGLTPTGRTISGTTIRGTAIGSRSRGISIAPAATRK